MRNMIDCFWSPNSWAEKRELPASSSAAKGCLNGDFSIVYRQSKAHSSSCHAHPNRIVEKKGDHSDDRRDEIMHLKCPLRSSGNESMRKSDIEIPSRFKIWDQNCEAGRDGKSPLAPPLLPLLPDLENPRGRTDIHDSTHPTTASHSRRGNFSVPRMLEGSEYSLDVYLKI